MTNARWMHRDRRLDEFAARQYGVFSVSQARSAGLSPRMIRTRIDSGAWVRLAPSIYAVASAPPKWERQMAAALLTRPGAIVAGRSAAYLHDFPGSSPGRPMMMIGIDGNHRSSIATVIRSERFQDVGRVRRLGFVVTDEAETVLTMARELDQTRLEALVDWLLARKSCSIEDLSAVVDVSAGMPGMAKLRPIVAYRQPTAYQPPTSELERLLYRLLDSSLLPRVTRQLPIHYRQVDLTVDAFIGAWGLIVEGDGRRWHTRRADLERDRLRDNEATAHGLAVLRFSYEMLRDTPGQCLDTLLRTGRVRAVS